MANTVRAFPTIDGRLRVPRRITRILLHLSLKDLRCRMFLDTEAFPNRRCILHLGLSIAIMSRFLSDASAFSRAGFLLFLFRHQWLDYHEHA